MQNSAPPAGAAMPPLPQKKRRWPCLVAGCGCLTIIVLIAAALISLFLTGLIGGQDTSDKFGSYEWRRDGDGAFMFFESQDNRFSFELAGSKFGGVVHGTGYWKMSGNIMTYKLGPCWVDIGQVSEKGVLSPFLAAELKLEQEQKLRLAWQGEEAFTLSDRWSLVPRETWRRQSRRSSDGWHYPVVHKTTEHWVDGEGWAPDQATQPKTSTTRPEPTVVPQAAELAREKGAIASAAIMWLQVLDRGDYRASYAQAGPAFRKDTTLDQWRTGQSKMRQMFGNVKLRDDNASITRSDSESGGHTTSTYRVVIHTTFTKRNGTETVTLMQESGEWKVSDYSIEAAR